MQFLPQRPTRDEHDERWARWMREEFGQKKWLVSWLRLDDGRGWLARLSCPEVADTLEADGRTRCLAIGRAHRALEAQLAALRGGETLNAASGRS